MLIKTIYHYDNNGFITATGEFDTGIYTEVPPKSTLVEKPPEGEHQKARFNVETQTWELIPDYRGCRFVDSNGNIHVITELGVAPDDGWVVYEVSEPDPLEQRLTEVEDAILTLMFGGVA